MLFKDGTFKLRGKEVSVAGQTLPVVEGYKVGVRGGYVTVNGAAVPGFPDRNIKVMVSGADSVVESADSVTAAEPESDDETIARIRTRFNMLNDMTKAVKKGDVRAMIVSGPPGVGKSHGVEEGEGAKSCTNVSYHSIRKKHCLKVPQYQKQTVYPKRNAKESNHQFRERHYLKLPPHLK